MITMEKPTIQEVETWLMKLYTTSQESITPAERREQNMYATMVEKPSDKKFLVKMLDESSQIRDDRKLAKRIKVLIDEYGVPEFLNARDRLLFKMVTTSTPSPSPSSRKGCAWIPHASFSMRHDRH